MELCKEKGTTRQRGLFTQNTPDHAHCWQMDDAMTTMTTMMAGELAIGMGMRIVAGHPQLRSDRCYTIVAHLPDESGYLVDATPPRATKFPELAAHGARAAR